MNLQAIAFLLVFIVLVIINGTALYRIITVDKNIWLFTIIFLLYIFIMPLGALVAIFYLFYFSKKRLSFKEISSWFAKK